MREAMLPRLIGVGLLSMSTAVMVAWLVHEPAVLQALPGYAMVFNTALCFALAGLALLFEGSTLDARPTAQSSLGVAIVAIAALSLVQHIFPVDLRIDASEAHRWLADGSVHPGRMAVMVCVGLMLSGAVLVLKHRVTRAAHAHAVRSLTIAVALIGVLSVAGQILGLQQVFRSYVFARVSLPASLGFVLLSIGLAAAWRHEPWSKARVVKSDISRIMFATAITTIVIAAVCGLAGFVVMQRSAEKSLGDDLARILDARIADFTQAIDQSLHDATRLASQPSLADDLAALVVPSSELRARKLLQTFADEAATLGFSAVVVRDARGSKVVQAGEYLTAPESTLHIQRPGNPALLWAAGRFVLQTEMAINGHGRALGSVAAQQPLPEIGDLLERVQAGETGELLICAPAGTAVECAPSRLRRRPFQLPRLRQNKTPTSVALAVNGARGVQKLIDRQGNEAIAAYAPVANLGLGMVLRQNTVELYAPIREQLLQLVPLIAIMLAAAVAVLHSLIMPLARELALSEERLQLALDGSRLALWDWDFSNGQIYLSQNWQLILGGEAEPVTITPDALESRVHPEDVPRVKNHLRDVLKGARKQYDLEYRVRTLSGEWKWIHSKGRVVERLASGYATRLTGTNADIDQQKQAALLIEHQARHDALTGMRNRTLFHEHLKHAMASTRRHGRLMAVLYLDIDRFKTVNDTLGHAAGDALLRAFTQRLADCVRRADTVARMGGDEFTVILEELEHRDDGTAVARKIVEAMRAGFEIEQRIVKITTSIGIAFFEGEAGVMDDELVRRADAALYEAKSAGRDGYRVARLNPV